MLPTAVDDPFGCFVGAPIVVPGKPGCPVVAIKDNIDMAGLPTRAGLGGIGRIAEADAPVVQRLRAGGCTLIGKTRMDEIALGATGDNPHGGRTENPRAPGHSPGGSSSGSAAAVAAGMCDAALGTDTLGSVRIPAAFCGVVGLKPTRRLLSTDGVVPLSWTLDHVGIIARSVDAAADLLATVLGRRPASSAGPLRIGVPDALGSTDLDGDTMRLFRDALCRLEGRGSHVDECSIRSWNPSATRRAGLLLLEAEGACVHRDLLSSGDAALSAAARRALAYGRDCGTGRLVQALRTLREAADGLDEALATRHLIALPTVPAPAFDWASGAPPDLADLTALANFGGHPAISVPIGSVQDGRPVGLQLIAPRGADWHLLDAALSIEADAGATA